MSGRSGSRHCGGAAGWNGKPARGLEALEGLQRGSTGRSQISRKDFARLQRGLWGVEAEIQQINALITAAAAQWPTTTLAKRASDLSLLDALMRSGHASCYRRRKTVIETFCAIQYMPKPD